MYVILCEKCKHYTSCFYENEILPQILSHIRICKAQLTLEDFKIVEVSENAFKLYTAIQCRTGSLTWKEKEVKCMSTFPKKKFRKQDNHLWEMIEEDLKEVKGNGVKKTVER